jgi:hypothetical protein
MLSRPGGTRGRLDEARNQAERLAKTGPLPHPPCPRNRIFDPLIALSEPLISGLAGSTPQGVERLDHDGYVRRSTPPGALSLDHADSVLFLLLIP